MATTPPGAAPPGAAPPEFQITTQAPAVSFLLRNLPPPSFVYMTRDDQLELGVMGPVLGTTVRFTYRFLRTDGVLITGTQDVSTLVADDFGAIDITLGEGYLLSVGAIILTNGTFSRGDNFVQVTVIRQDPSDTLFSMRLISDYITLSRTVGWPVGSQSDPLDGAGSLISQATAVPGAGAEITQTVPSNEQWKIRGVRYSLTTSATVATRRTSLRVTDGANVFYEIDSGVTQAASLTVTYDWIPNYPSTGVTLTDVDNPLPDDLRLRNAWVIQTSTASIQAGDQYTAARLLVERWIRR